MFFVESAFVESFAFAVSIFGLLSATCCAVIGSAKSGIARAARASFMLCLIAPPEISRLEIGVGGVCSDPESALAVGGDHRAGTDEELELHENLVAGAQRAEERRRRFHAVVGHQHRH